MGSSIGTSLVLVSSRELLLGLLFIVMSKTMNGLTRCLGPTRKTSDSDCRQLAIPFREARTGHNPKTIAHEVADRALSEINVVRRGPVKVCVGPDQSSAGAQVRRFAIPSCRCVVCPVRTARSRARGWRSHCCVTSCLDRTCIRALCQFRSRPCIIRVRRHPRDPTVDHAQR